MNRCLILAAGMAMCVTSLVSTAKALPPIMDRVPANAAMAVVIPSIEGLERDVKSMMSLAGLPAEAFNIEQMLGGEGLGAISRKGSLALVMLSAPTPDSGDEPIMIAICQADDYAALAKDLNAVKDGELDKAAIDGNDVYMKSIGGGFVVAGNDKETIAKFDGKGGSSDAHKAFFGSRGDKLSDKADVAVFFNMPKLKPMINEGFAGMEQQLADLAAMGGQAGDGESLKWVKDHVLADLTGGVAAISIDAQGCSFDVASIAKEGTPLAKALDTAGKAHALLGKLPGGPYLAAYAMDMSNKGWKDLFNSMPKPAEDKSGGGLTAMMGADPAVMENATGMSMVVGVPPGGIMGGALTRTTAFVQTSTPDKVIAFYRDEMPKALEKDQLGKMEYKSSVSKIDGHTIDAFDMTIEADEGMQGMGPQIMQGMFGMTGGPTGYITTVDGGVVSTMSKSTEMMTAAIKATKGENTFTTDKVLAAVAEKLPSGRAMEGYIGVKGLLDTLLPMAGMVTGKPIKLDIPEKLPPIAGGLAMGERQVQATFYIPADVIKVGGQIARTLNAGDGNGDGMDDGEGAAPKEEKKANPKF